MKHSSQMKTISSKSKYYGLEFSFVHLSEGSSILSSSVFVEAQIDTEGQEIAEELDFNDPATADPGKEFNHEWI